MKPVPPEFLFWRERHDSEAERDRTGYPQPIRNTSGAVSADGGLNQRSQWMLNEQLIALMSGLEPRLPCSEHRPRCSMAAHRSDTHRSGGKVWFLDATFQEVEGGAD